MGERKAKKERGGDPDVEGIGREVRGRNTLNKWPNEMNLNAAGFRSASSKTQTDETASLTKT